MFFAAGAGPEVENKWLHQSGKKIAARQEASGVNASQKCTNTKGMGSLRTLFGRKQTRPLAENVDWKQAVTT